MDSVSETDVRVMSQLANTEKLSTSRLQHDFATSNGKIPLIQEIKSDVHGQQSDDEESQIESHHHNNGFYEEDDDEEDEDEDEEDEEEEEQDNDQNDLASEPTASPPKRPSPVRKKFDDVVEQKPKPTRFESSFDSVEAERLEKQSILLDMEKLKMQGIKLSKIWTLNDNINDMKFELRRHSLHMEELNNINFMRDGLRMLCTGTEMLNTRFNLLQLQGWSNDVCSNMDKYDPALSKIYRKYWKRSLVSSPEMEIAMGLLGSMGMYHFKQKLSNKFFNVPRGQQPREAPEIYEEDDSGSEAAPN